jgi:hypothetical protein
MAAYMRASFQLGARARAVEPIYELEAVAQNPNAVEASSVASPECENSGDSAE